MKRVLAAGVTAVTLLAASAASADPAPAASAAPAPAPAALPMRDSKPLTLAQPPASTSWPYKLAFGALIVVGGVVAWKKKRGGGAIGKPAAREATLRVAARAPLGMRAEVAVIEVDGMRVLVGVTGTNVQALAVLPDDDAETAATAPTTEIAETSRTTSQMRLGSRARALFGDLDDDGARPVKAAASRYAEMADDDDAEPRARIDIPRAPKKPRARRASAPAAETADADKPLEGQARGLALALGSRK